jgi:hypothetical protein
MTNATHDRSTIIRIAFLAAAIGGSAVPQTALALPIVGYSLQVSEGITGGGGGPLMASAQLIAARDMPLFTLTNTSTDALITQFSITIGDLAYNFDAVTFNQLPTGPQVTSFTPDKVQGGAKSDVLSLSFTNFAASQAFAFRGDIDRDSDNGLALTNFRTVLTGATPSVVTVKFSDGSTLTNTLASTTDGNPLSSVYRCAALVSTPALVQQATAISQTVPEPDGFTLACLAATGLLLATGWRRVKAGRRLAAA